MTIQEKYKYLYDNYAKDPKGYFSEIISVCYRGAVITEEEFDKLCSIYNNSKFGLVLDNYREERGYCNYIVLAVNLLYSKCKAFEEKDFERTKKSD